MCSLAAIAVIVIAALMVVSFLVAVAIIGKVTVEAYTTQRRVKRTLANYKRSGR
jgi:Flp pilus assembly protein TadB